MTLPSNPNHLEAEPFLRNHPHLSGSHASYADPERFPTNEMIKHPADYWASERLDLPRSLMNQLNTLSKFSALVIEQNQPTEAGCFESLHHTMMQILENREPSMWSIKWRDNLYVALLPNGDIAEANEHARHIQSELARSRPETISIGITSFPLLDFNPVQTIGNGAKALDHAAFFGPGTIIVFDAVSLNISGDQYYQSGDVHQAVTQYRAAMAMDSTNTNVLNSLGVCLAHDGDLAKARKLFESAWQYDQSEAMAIYNLAIIELIDNSPEKALPLLEQAVVLNLDCYDIPFRLGKLLHDQQAYQDAISHLKNAIALREDSALAHYYLGECLARTAQPKAAIAALSRAIKLNPNDAAALSTLGVLYTACNENPDICEAFFQQSITLSPEKGTFHHRLGQFYLKQCRWDQALRAFQNAQTLGHNCVEQLSMVRQNLNTGTSKDARCA